MERMNRIVSVSMEAISPQTRGEALDVVAKALTGTGSRHPRSPAYSFTRDVIEAEGGWITRDLVTRQVVAAGPQPTLDIGADEKTNVRMGLPATEIAYGQLGLVCLLRSMALVAALTQLAKDHPLGSILVAFRGGQPPSIDTIENFGLCLMAAKYRADGKPANRASGTPANVPIDLALLPKVCASLVPMIGQSQVVTTGEHGRARVVQGSTGTLFSKAHLPFIQALGQGRMSLIGLPDAIRPLFDLSPD